MEILKLLSTSEIVAQVISFLILLFLLRIFAWKKILSLLDQRRDKIAAEFKQIEDAKHDVSRIKEELEAKLTKIQEIQQHKIEEAITKGKELTEQIRKKAQEEAQDIINKAKEDIRHELAEVKDELKEKIIDLTINAAETVIHERITKEQDKGLIREFLEKMDKVK